MNSSRFKVLFLDFYGTVAAGDADAVEATCAKVVADLGLAFSPHEFAVEWGNRFFRTMDASHEADFRTLYECECDSLVETCRELADISVDPRPYADDLFEYMCNPPLHPEVHDFLSSLPIPVCCVSNADNNHLSAAIESHQLSFDAVVSSEGARSYKPHPGLFQAALETMGVASSEVLHVGDSLHSDIDGARRVGIEAVWICRDRRIHDVGELDADHKIACLSELSAILG